MTWLRFAAVALLCVSLSCIANAKSGENTAQTTRLWELMRLGDAKSLNDWIQSDASVVELRSEDGRGALWWAYEFGRAEMARSLIAAGADENDVDAYGNTPISLLNKGAHLAYTPPPAGSGSGSGSVNNEDDEEDEEDEDEL